MTRSIFAMPLIAIPMMAAVANIPNPVIPNVADIGVMKYNGKYYLGGCRTDGDFYISTDLINWEGPIHVIDMANDWSKGTGCGNNQIHANDMLYDNGTIHAYWSVNYWGPDRHAVHIVHSEASDPMGPYEEPVKDRWMDNRIDPKVFRDDDGQLYMYMVRFTDGNTIWARRMKNWREFDESSPDAMVCQFASLPNTWERMDNAVAEGPWVIKYHDKYYMMYNANHTGGEWGNYQLGVAQSETPMGFNNGNKYPHPVVLSNQKALEDDHVELLRYSTGTYEPLFAYTTSNPGSGWNTTAYDDSNWQRGASGFAPSAERGTTTYRRGTHWDTDTIRLRKSFMLNDTCSNLALRLTSRGPTKVWLNGTEIYDSPKGEYTVINLTPAMRRTLAPGSNILAIESTRPERQRGRRNGYISADLFDMGKEVADPVITWTPGQPNILRGPNGFEWWLIYMANDDAKSRSQYIDRVHFHGDKMVVDGITHADNGGYHPTPALPAYGDTFDRPLDPSKWDNIKSGKWEVADGELHALAGASATLSPSLQADSYLWEVSVKPDKTAGVIALWVDGKNNAEILFDKSRNEWTVTETAKGKRRTLASAPLRDDFRWDAYHQIRVERDMADLIISIDEQRLPQPVVTSLSSAAVPGLTCEGPAKFDGITYTIGFDDGNDRMNGWEVLSGTLSPTGRGASATGKLIATKGTPALAYEATTQVSGLKDNTIAGFMPLYVDADNYVSAELDADKQLLRITTAESGKPAVVQEIPVDYIRTLYADARFTDSYDKGYTTDTPTIFDAIYLKRYDVANRNVFTDNRFDKETSGVGDREIFIDNMFSLMDGAYVAKDGSWVSIDTENARVDRNPAYNIAEFKPVKASRLRFINRDPSDGAHHIYDIRLHELFKESYNLRAVRDGDTLRIFLDGRELATLPVSQFGPSVIGLTSSDGTPEFHGLTYYHR